VSAKATEVDFSLVEGDPLHRAQQALGLVPREGGFGVRRRILLAVAITWLPLVVYALFERRLLPGVVPEPLFEHFGIHARFLLALPLLFVAEATVEASLRRVLPQFLATGLVDAELRPSFERILADARRLRGSRVALAVLLALVVLWTVAGFEVGSRAHELAWTAPAEGDARPLRFGVLWFALVSQPLFLLALLAWLWRLALLTWILARISRLELRLVPTHPDRVGGLGFLEPLPGGLVPVFLAIAVPIAGRFGHDAVYHGHDVRSFQIPVFVLLAVLLALGLTPLLAFAPRLRALRRQGLAAWGALLAQHGRLVERRWIRREPVADDALLAAPELGPVADTIALFEAVKRMRPAPIGLRSVLPIALATLLPLIPVFATQVPLRTIAAKLFAPLLGM
jgi:hypothetical protein